MLPGLGTTSDLSASLLLDGIPLLDGFDGHEALDVGDDLGVRLQAVGRHVVHAA